MESPNLEQALSDWRHLLGDDSVITYQKFLQDTAANCAALTNQSPALLRPDCTSAVQQVVQIAAKHQISLYPFSTGCNWGYGSKNPAQDHCVLVDLSRMNKILDFDKETGLLTIEPGVTQRQLDAYLKQHHHPYLIPVTGAGPDCSLVGNALERGYGITPYADHFAAVMGLEAVLPNGKIYRSMLSGLGGGAVDKAFKWGMGPYMDGLFSQSNFGIVTKMTIALAPTPERVEAFFFSVKKADDLGLAVEKVRQVLREVGTVTGSINLMNKHRVLSMSEPYPKDRLGSDGLIPEDVLQQLMKRNQVMEWTGVGAIYGNKKVVAAARGEIRRILKPVAKRLIFFTPGLVKFLHSTAQALPIIRDLHLVNVLGTLNKTMQLFAGEPSEIALPLAYWRSGVMPTDGTSMNPDKDGCGLIWYSPLLPMKPDLTREYVEMVKSICIKHRIEPLITLTSISDRCWDSTIPILFDRQDADEVARAQACYHELLDTGRKHGFVPYRLGIQSMELPAKENAVPDVLRSLKQAVDPNNIIAPGRYGL
ncbi:FAD-binding oxidoreductase [Methylomonas fluvii]|uniref:FAD-binding oxidoreductase n=1 Tax=Methylomonas fluvii TaxID=1854564 RepID=A0ABR9DC79_9GAMM|nr:FAD-binding oxidoreductase [Methylomonas fluvii]MBD9360709.1 FAD-binding oxidoreductase [Methylomonas fluvii]CAD6873561.1 4-cresol dehydrogenase [hydroxylating] flavoprotein subunit (EC 1.17.99.1) [Methylomonas fluvii]